MKSKHTFVVLAYKESKYLEKCIQSVLNQSYKSNVVIATTPNKYISRLADDYNLEIIMRANGLPEIRYDFEFA
ncbi:glycosyltransferase family A protein [Faecalicoccus pleomorphus]|uniref:glycosyltransferase family A protein n=1 Tax=Faecalicoccus pleomorphus TaxID=1323 RepID=UPI001EF6E7FC|nr:glycosyltransferase family A protein [Faecalicoccus pleomorphus]